MRNNQYNLEPVPVANATEWRGRLNRNPNLWMIGEIRSDPNDLGHFYYMEWLWDDTNGRKLIVRTVANCTRVRDLNTLQRVFPANPPSPQYASPSVPPDTTGNTPTSSGETVPMLAEGGTFKVPVTINGQLTLNFIVDSGAADVSIPADVVLTLWRTGTIAESDFLGSETYKMADGSTVPSQQFTIRSLKVGDRVLENVTGSVAPVAGGLLLGQSFLARFKSWSIDNQQQALILN
jgi:clan AA aspartic protease (TIGR02281 family)